jgi:hypothetical protein
MCHGPASRQKGHDVIQVGNADHGQAVKRTDLLHDTRGKGERFHGTSTPIAALSDYYGSETSIYGTGFYTTDAVDIARGYSKKGRGGQPSLYSVTEKPDVKLFNMEDPVPDFLREDGNHDLIALALEEDPKSLRELFDEVRASSRDEGVTRTEVQEIFDTVIARLEALGYRGFSHVGGLKTNNAPHDVRIYWTPEQDVEFKQSSFDDYRIAPEPAARGLSDLIPEARADRTDTAFNRQFVDEMEETATVEKAKPKDRIEAAKMDGEDWGEIVDQFREQGRVTEADDASLKEADELGAWAERRAKAFEAAASCLTVA